MVFAQNRKTNIAVVPAGDMQWSPFAGCLWSCAWCEPRCSMCGSAEPHFHQELLTAVPNSKHIRVCTQGDISHASTDIVRSIFDVISRHRNRTFEIASRDPGCFVYWEDVGVEIPENVVLATYVETGLRELSVNGRRVKYADLSTAPHPVTRLKDLKNVEHGRKAVKMFPLCQFDTSIVKLIKAVNPEWVEVGYGPKKLRLPEPTLHRTISLIMALSQFTNVKVLGLREAWYAEYFKPALPKLCRVR